MEFEWDPKKAAANIQKHNVTFQEAATVLTRIINARLIDRDERIIYEEG
jgi:uncharacterized DUF497 family protein